MTGPQFEELKKRFVELGGQFRKTTAKELFELKGNPQLDKENFTFSETSSYPYFTRTVNNNGIFGYVDYLDESHLIKGNSLAVGMMAMRFFYMEHDFYAGQFTKTAFPRFEGFNGKVAMWFIAHFEKYTSKYLGVLVRNFESEFYATEFLVPFVDGKICLSFMEQQVDMERKTRLNRLSQWLERQEVACITPPPTNNLIFSALVA